jgi:tetratricopeptide (TPR) repeat protein
MRFPTISYPRVNIMKASRDWRYVGVIHEYATCTPAAAEYLLSGIHMETDGQGARGRSPDKAQRDLAVMQQSVVDEPDNPRYWFYLAQGYEVAGRVDEAIQAYAHRARMGDYYEEIWYSHYRMAQLHVLQQEWDLAVIQYLRAFEIDPTRAEPLYWLAIGYHNRGSDRLALVFLEAVCLMNEPISALFVEPAVYQILRWIHYAVCLYNLGQTDDAKTMAQKCLNSGKVPPQYLAALQRILIPPLQQVPA